MAKTEKGKKKNGTRYTRKEWERIEQAWAAGQLAKIAISRKFGPDRNTIESHMKRAGIVYGSLADNVRLKVAAELVAGESTGESTADREAVDSAAKEGANVIRTHRKDIQSLREQARQTIDKSLKFVDQIETVDDAVKLAGLQNTLSTTFSRLIPLERQAYSLDDPAVQDADKALSVAAAIIQADKEK